MGYELIVNKRRYEDLSTLVGFFSSLFITLLGIAYLGIIIIMLFSDNFANPPMELQIVMAIIDLLLCPLLIILFASVHYSVPNEKRIFSLLTLMFSAIAGGMVAINRFIQITVIRLVIKDGDLRGLSRLYPYDTRSVTFALEWLGFGLFLTIALLFATFALNPFGPQRIAKSVFYIYILFGFVSIAGYLTDTNFAYTGYAAWGFVLYIGTGFLCAFFLGEKRAKEARNKIIKSKNPVHPVK